MHVVGKSSYLNKNNERVSTLYLICEFDDFACNEASHRTCDGQCVEVLYVGKLDISAIEIGDAIEVIYGKAVKTRDGFYQPVKDVIVL